eukprot:CAMPEP_0202869362 /NCGR_PEP_ID=MMETSP1391-20130828/12412_1 /ASSEMBLY_ACC=CAM_ASM_000867 /TAXON_ID=1034604 /ORGANISM="Chlamydomonas leiostraca, Strain SAG 11-49" /LENGTH=424 /DNA_ID=CAMNT_0049549675 /DNA_START=99 /DNA_END=1374 /DNA_ORIENTATION=+
MLSVSDKICPGASAYDAHIMWSSEQEREFQALLEDLRPLATPQLRAAAAERPTATTTAFLSWLGEKSRPRPDGRSDAAAREAARVAEVLVSFREWQEESASRQLLPALAASAAYDNLLRWKAEASGGAHGAAASGPVEVGLGADGQMRVDIEQLYRAAEKEEQKLTGAAVSQRSAVDSFASRPGNEMYASIAASAMARARARLMGFESGSSAASAVLDALLALDGGRGERAMALDEACTAPGIVIPSQPPSTSADQAGSNSTTQQPNPDAAGTSPRSAGKSVPTMSDSLMGRVRGLGAYGSSLPGSSKRGGSTSGYGAASGSAGSGSSQAPKQQARAATNPQALRTEISKRLADLEGAVQGGGGAPDAAGSASASGASSADRAVHPTMLPTGEVLVDVLRELLEDAAEYESRIWVHKPPQERVL